MALGVLILLVVVFILTVLLSVIDGTLENNEIDELQEIYQKRIIKYLRKNCKAFKKEKDYFWYIHTCLLKKDNKKTNNDICDCVLNMSSVCPYKRWDGLSWVDNSKKDLEERKRILYFEKRKRLNKLEEDIRNKKA